MLGTSPRIGQLAITCLLTVLACARAPAEPASSAAAPTAAADACVMARWERSCALCHIRGEGGAPRAGDADQWRPRLAKGMETLVRHTLEGYNNMPPLGYCMSCETGDFEALIRFMSDASP